MTNIEHKITTLSTYISTMLLLTGVVNNIFIGGLFITMFGSTFPDWDIKIFGSGSSPEGFINVYGHRGVTHYYKIYLILYLLILAGLFVLSLLNGELNPIWFFSISCFICACFAHILEDSVTTAGIPIYRVYEVKKSGAGGKTTIVKKKTSLYKSFSFKIGNFDSKNVAILAWGVTIINIIITVYLVHIKHVTVSFGKYHA